MKDNNQANSGAGERKNNPNQESFWKKEYSLKRWVLILIVVVLLVGFVFPMFAEIIIGTLYPEQVKGVEVWNQFTSIILGIVATVLSLVSMFMGFKSYDDSVELQKTCVQMFEHIKTVERHVDNMSSFSVQSEVKDQRQNWEPENIPQRQE